MPKYNLKDDILNNRSISNTIDNELHTIIKINKNNLKNKTKNILVLSGGDMKGIAHIGVMKAMKDLRILRNIRTVAGSSVGAIIGLLFVIGYTPEELYDFVIMFDLDKLKSLEPIKFLNNFGMDNGKKLSTVLGKMMRNKNFPIDITFRELYLRTDIHLITTATCLNTKQIKYFDYVKYPDMQVLTAVRMSSCFPIYFIPISYENNIYVDGGCLDNYPIGIFRDKLEETVGVFLKNIYVEKHSIKNTEDFLFNLIQCLSEGRNNNCVNGYEKYSIIIKLDNIKVLDLQMDEKSKQKIFSNGYDAAIKFFNSNI